MTDAPTPAQILREAKALISDPSKWTQGAYARDANGHDAVVSSLDPTRWCSEGAGEFVDPVCWCSVGAVEHVTNRLMVGGAKRSKVRRALQEVTDGSILNFNDTHTHAEVMAAFDQAIELAEAGQ